MNPQISIFPSVQELTEFFIAHLEERLRNHATDQPFSMALSGGSTPRAIFDRIATRYRERIDWSRILFFWGDERCVAPENEQSNYRMAAESLLNPLHLDPRCVFRIAGENDPAAEAFRYSEQATERLPLKNGFPRFDMVWLGLGDDGHTASIFPHNIHLFYSEKLFEVSEHPVTRQKRITATGRIINNAAEILFIATGDSKAKMVKQILQPDTNSENLPAALVKPTDGNLIWLLDEAAANQI